MSPCVSSSSGCCHHACYTQNNLNSVSAPTVYMAFAGLLQIFGKLAAEHLHKIQIQLQQHPGDLQTAEQVVTSAHMIGDAAQLLLHAVAIVHTSEPPQHQVDVVKQCAQNMLTVVFWVVDQQHALPPLRPVLVGDLCQFFTNPEGAQAAANLAQQLQCTAQSVIAG